MSMEKNSKICVANIGLGRAWAGNTVNTAIFRGQGVFSRDGFQYASYYEDESNLRIVKRNLNNNEVESFSIRGNYNLKDAHNCISMGMDRSGFIHISYDHHGTKLRYRVSSEPRNIHFWSDEQEMTGQNEGKVTYPTFIQPKSGNPLMLLLRDGSAENGAAFIKRYDERLLKWHDYEKPILSGKDPMPETANAYWNHPVTDEAGVIHISFVWRRKSIGDAELVNNSDVAYVVSEDGGSNWLSAQKKKLQLPITPLTSGSIWAVEPGSNLINQCGMAVDSQQDPHLCFYSNDPNGIPQYQHLWRKGQSWHHNFLSARTSSFNLTGRGTLKIPMSRPEILIGKNDDVILVYRADFTGDKLVAQILKAPDYCPRISETTVIFSDSVGYSEPVIDKERWEKDKVLSVLVQACEQPDHDVGHLDIKSKIRIIDFKLY